MSPLHVTLPISAQEGALTGRGHDEARASRGTTYILSCGGERVPRMRHFPC